MNNEKVHYLNGNNIGKNSEKDVNSLTQEKYITKSEFQYFKNENDLKLEKTEEKLNSKMELIRTEMKANNEILLSKIDSNNKILLSKIDSNSRRVDECHKKIDWIIGILILSLLIPIFFKLFLP